MSVRDERESGTTAPTLGDFAALARCNECFDDGQDTDVGRPMLDRLTELGWLDKIGRNRWQISPEGEAILQECQARE